MALMNVEASAFLVGKEGLNPKALPIVTAGLIGLFEVGDQKDGFFILSTPPANGVERDRRSLREANLRQRKEVSWLQWIVSKRLVCGAGLDINLGCSAQNVLPSRVFFHPEEHFGRIVLRIAQQDDLATFWQEWLNLFQYLNMAFRAGMAFLALVDQPGNRQCPFLIQDSIPSTPCSRVPLGFHP